MRKRISTSDYGPAARMEKCFANLKVWESIQDKCRFWAVLVKEDGCSCERTASQLGGPPTVTVSIQRLEKIGIIVRKQDEKDQRISRIYLTEEGKAIINEGMRAWQKEGKTGSERIFQKVSYV